MPETERKLCTTCAATTFGCLLRDGAVLFLRDGGERSELLSKFPALTVCTQADDLQNEEILVASLVCEFDSWECSEENVDDIHKINPYQTPKTT